MRGLVVGAILCAGCTSIGGGGDEPARDATAGDGDGAPGSNDAAAGDALGSANNPAESCAQLRDAGDDSGVYWIQHPVVADVALQLYCEQELGGGGWAMLYNSVLTEAGVTTAFFQIAYADRFMAKGVADPAENYYYGALYLIGTEYLDVITDLLDTTAVAARVDAEGIDATTMAFVSPTLVAGNAGIFTQQFGSGWSSADHDADTNPDNCATIFSSVSQHYGSCWAYNLGSDADDPKLDGGVGPHVNSGNLDELGLEPQADGGGYSRVKRIARFTRW